MNYSFNFLSEENLSEDLTNEWVASAQIKTSQGIDKNMKNSPFRRDKVQTIRIEPLSSCNNSDSKLWKSELYKSENKTMELLKSQIPCSPEFSSRRNITSNSRTKSTPVNMKEDISFLLKEVIKIRKVSDSEANEVKSYSPSWNRNKIIESGDDKTGMEFNKTISMKDIGSVPCL